MNACQPVIRQHLGSLVHHLFPLGSHACSAITRTRTKPYYNQMQTSSLTVYATSMSRCTDKVVMLIICFMPTPLVSPVVLEPLAKLYHYVISTIPLKPHNDPLSHASYFCVSSQCVISTFTCCTWQRTSVCHHPHWGCLPREYWHPSTETSKAFRKTGSHTTKRLGKWSTRYLNTTALCQQCFQLPLNDFGGAV